MKCDQFCSLFKVDQIVITKKAVQNIDLFICEQRPSVSPVQLHVGP